MTDKPDLAAPAPRSPEMSERDLEMMRAGAQVAMWLYAYIIDGISYVGTTGKTLTDARLDVTHGRCDKWFPDPEDVMRSVHDRDRQPPHNAEQGRPTCTKFEEVR